MAYMKSKTCTHQPEQFSIDTCCCCHCFDAWIPVSSIYDSQLHKLPLLKLIFSISLEAIKISQRQDRLLFMVEAGISLSVCQWKSSSRWICYIVNLT